MKFPKVILILLMGGVLVTPGLVGLWGMGEVGSRLKAFKASCDSVGQCAPVCNDAGQCLTVTDFSLRNFWFFTKVSASAKFKEVSRGELPLVMKFDSTLFHGPVLFSDGRLQFGLLAHAGEVALITDESDAVRQTVRLQFSDTMDFSGQVRGRLFSQMQLINFEDKGARPMVAKLGPFAGDYLFSSADPVLTVSLKTGPISVLDDVREEQLGIKSIAFEGRKSGHAADGSGDWRFMVQGVSIGTAPITTEVEQILLTGHNQARESKIDGEVNLEVTGFKMVPALVPFENLSFSLSAQALDAPALIAAQEQAQQLQANQDAGAVMAYLGLLPKVFSGAQLKKVLWIGDGNDKKAFVASELAIKLKDLGKSASTQAAVGGLLAALDADWSVSVASQLVPNPAVKPILDRLLTEDYVRVIGDKYSLNAKFSQGSLLLFGKPVPLESLMGLAMALSSQPMTEPDTSQPSPQSPGATPEVVDSDPAPAKSQAQALPQTPQPPAVQFDHSNRSPSGTSMIKFRTADGEVGFTDNPHKIPAGATPF